MLTMKKLTLMGAAGALWGLSALLLSPMAHGATYSDAGAAVVVYPKIVVDTDNGVDTLVTLTNQANKQVAAHCFYVNANNRCNNTLQACQTSGDCFDPVNMVTGTCAQGWIEINFDIILTPNQPVVFSAFEGLGNSNLPCPGGLGGTNCGKICSGAQNNPNNGFPCSSNADCMGGSCIFASNAGTRVPPVGEDPFVGELKCIEADAITRLPATCNCDVAPGPCACPSDLEGTAIIETVDPTDPNLVVDTARYNAVGLRPTGFNNGDRELVIGGPSPDPSDPTLTCLDQPPELRCEYQPCASVLIFDLLFDGAIDPISDTYVTRSSLTLVPCTQDFLRQRIPQVTAQFLVFNEFEQRLSTSRLVNCVLDSQISLIDTSQFNRSIFYAPLQGTVAGQARITGVDGGLIGSAELGLCQPPAPGTACGNAAYNLNQFADREQADFIRIP